MAKKAILLVIVFAIILVGGLIIFASNNAVVAPTPTPKIEDSNPNLSTTMKITSTEFEHNQNIPEKYSCDGDNISPPLSFEGVPETAKSLVLISDDPDAPNGDWVHWLVWDIDPETKGIEESSVPAKSIEGTTSFGTAGYGGPCPPSGTHRYFFKLYALDTKLGLKAEARKSDLLSAMEGHILEQTELIGIYSR